MSSIETGNDQAGDYEKDRKEFRVVSMYQGPVAVENNDADSCRCENQAKSAETFPQVWIDDEAGEDQGGAHGPREGFVLKGCISPEPHPESKGCRDDAGVSNESGSGRLSFQGLEDIWRGAVH
jgi:hypothetical protein